MTSAPAIVTLRDLVRRSLAAIEAMQDATGTTLAEHAPELAGAAELCHDLQTAAEATYRARLAELRDGAKLLRGYVREQRRALEASPCDGVNRAAVRITLAVEVLLDQLGATARLAIDHCDLMPDALGDLTPEVE